MSGLGLGACVEAGISMKSRHMIHETFLKPHGAVKGTNPHASELKEFSVVAGSSWALWKLQKAAGFGNKDLASFLRPHGNFPKIRGTLF